MIGKYFTNNFEISFLIFRKKHEDMLKGFEKGFEKFQKLNNASTF